MSQRNESDFQGGGGGGGGFPIKIYSKIERQICQFYFLLGMTLSTSGKLSENAVRNNRLNVDTDRGTTCAVQQTGR